MRGGNSAHGPSLSCGASNGNGPRSPYMLACGMHLNPVPPCWQDLILDFGP